MEIEVDVIVDEIMLFGINIKYVNLLKNLC